MTAVTDPYYAALLTLTSRPSPLESAGDQALVARLRAKMDEVHDYRPPEVRVTEDRAPGPHGPVPVRTYWPPTAGTARPLLVWCHGGGFAFGDLDMPEADVTAREVCARAGAVVVSVDYRLAVDGVRFPVPLDDVVAAIDWVVARSATWDVDPDLITVGGASAGANLAAAAALRLRDEGRHAPASLLLLYPCVHPTLPPGSAEVRSKVSGLTPDMAFAPEVFRSFIENYLGGPGALATPYAMPALATLDGLPPTRIINCEYDGLRASGEAFATALRAAHVAVEESTVADVAHGHLNTPGLPEALDTVADMARWVGRRRSPGPRGD